MGDDLTDGFGFRKLWGDAAGGVEYTRGDGLGARPPHSIGRTAIHLGAIAVLVFLLGLALWSNAQSRRSERDWQAAVAQYRSRFPVGTTRAQIEAQFTKDHVRWMNFGGGDFSPNENPFGISVGVGSRPNRSCGTTIDASAIFRFARDIKAEVLTDEPSDPLTAITLEESDSCGVI